MNDIPFNITREEVLNLAACKLVDAYGCADKDIGERAEEMIREDVSALFSKENVAARIDAALTAELEKLLSQEIQPVTIWGEREGSPTTIRDALAERAKRFWEVKVNDKGQEYSYGEPRSTLLMKELLNDQFKKAIEHNAVVIVAEFKKAITADAVKMVTENINRLIR